MFWNTDEKITTKDIYNTFWRCRDFELTNLWQRSIFLTTFLVLCFTGYGSIFFELLDSIDNLENNFVQKIGVSVIGYIITLIGIVLSIMWIKMAKGSKAWYEVYEKAIFAIEKDEKYATKKATQFGGFSYYELDQFESIDINNSLLSSMAGQFSVSRINIGLGQLFLILWTVINLIHVITIAS